MPQHFDPVGPCSTTALCSTFWLWEQDMRWFPGNNRQTPGLLTRRQVYWVAYNEQVYPMDWTTASQSKKSKHPLSKAGNFCTFLVVYTNKLQLDKTSLHLSRYR